MSGESRRVLAVDEQRATLEFLHSVLPLVEGESFEIQRVLSAEEGLLELRRQPYDLLITGFRLPGMDGLELCRRAKHLRPTMATILVSSRQLPEVSDQTVAYGVDRLLLKPLDAEEFLSAVQASLAATPPAAALGDQTPAVEDPIALPSAAVSRLEMLCDETGAGQVLLATTTGEILYATGGKLHRDIPRLVAAASASVSRALELSQQLNEDEPKVVQFVEGLVTDLYWANIGRNYFIAILFDAQLRRGRIGTVWVFAQRAVSELTVLLAERSPGEATTAAESGDENALAEVPRPESLANGTAEDASQDDDQSEVTEDDQPALAREAVDAPAESEEVGRSPEDLALDAFWDDALAADSGDVAYGEGISLEEAKAKGLVAEDFDPEAERDD